MNRKLPAFLRFLLNPFRRLLIAIAPKLYVALQYRYITGKKLSLNNPQSYTAKLQAYRVNVYPHDPLVIHCTDRLGLIEYLKQNGLEAYQVPVLGVYASFDAIDFTTLPTQFVMKCTHASGMNTIVQNKATLNLHALKKQYTRWLKTNYGKKTYEMHYASIPPRILIEHYLGKGDSLPLEYKLHCFQGEMKYLYVVSGRGNDIRYTHFLHDWSPFPGAQFNGWKSSSYPILKPSTFSQMVSISEKLSKPFPFVRVDMYDIDGKLYVSELTFTPAKGTLNLIDPSVDETMGAWLP
jgi:hypothetical protein